MDEDEGIPLMEKQSKTSGRRGCGVRQPGGVYLETMMGCQDASDPRCKPLEYFLLDSPVPVEEGLGLGALGVTILERPDGSGIYDVYDHVGSSGYPNVADFIEETRRMGLSRRISRNEDFSKLTPGSRIYLAHARAILQQDALDAAYDALILEQAEYPGAHEFSCPCHNHEHSHLPGQEYVSADDEPEVCQMCAGLWWEDLEGGEESYDPDLPPRTVTRSIGSTTYRGRRGPGSAVARKYVEGFFMSLPIHQLAVINDPEGGEDEGSYDKATNSSLKVVREDA